jgi:hypothetical protein
MGEKLMSLAGFSGHGSGASGTGSGSGSAGIGAGEGSVVFEFQGFLQGIKDVFGKNGAEFGIRIWNVGAGDRFSGKALFGCG